LVIYAGRATSVTKLGRLDPGRLQDAPLLKRDDLGLPQFPRLTSCSVAWGQRGRDLSQGEPRAVEGWGYIFSQGHAEEVRCLLASFKKTSNRASPYREACDTVTDQRETKRPAARTIFCLSDLSKSYELSIGSNWSAGT
jgi:hypothetical protein